MAFVGRIFESKITGRFAPRQFRKKVGEQMPAARRVISLATGFLLAGLVYLISPFFPGFLPVGPASAPKPPLKPLPVESIVINHDQDRDGILDLDDIVEGARREVRAKTRYRSAYYQGGYPPEGEGVCTDVIWRALQNAGYDLKAMLDTDIKRNVREDYPRVNGCPLLEKCFSSRY